MTLTRAMLPFSLALTACLADPEPGEAWLPADAGRATGHQGDERGAGGGDGDGDGGGTGSGGDSASSNDTGSTGGATSPADATSGTSDGGSTSGTTTTSTAGSSGSSSTTGDPVAERDDPAGVCARWEADRVDMDEGTSTADVATCDPGTLSQGGRDNALRLLNLYRWLARQPPVTEDPALSDLAQACALIMAANGGLTHSPAMDAECYTSEGATGASRSNISGAPAVRSIDNYILDRNSLASMGHRRWMLSNSLGRTGTGTAGQYSCLHVVGGGGGGGGGQPFIALPGPGPYPFPALRGSRYGSLDETGWTVQASGSMANAVVTVTSGGMDLPVETRVLTGNGSEPAIAFTPMGWESEAGKSYHVEITGISTPISYDVDMVDCG